MNTYIASGDVATDADGNIVVWNNAANQWQPMNPRANMTAGVQMTQMTSEARERWTSDLRARWDELEELYCAMDDHVLQTDEYRQSDVDALFNALYAFRDALDSKARVDITAMGSTNPAHRSPAHTHSSSGY